MTLRIRGVALPERVERTFWTDGEVLRTEPPAGPGAAREVEPVVDGGWLVAGLVDVHTHPGAEQPEDGFDEAALRRHLDAHRDAGVLLVRTPGTMERMPGWVDSAPELPRVRSAGRWLATPGRFFPGVGRDLSEEQLPGAAVEEATASSGWCKIIGDWRWDEPAVPLEIMTEAVTARARGGRPGRRALPDGRGLAERRPRRRRQPRTRHASRPRPARPDGSPGHVLRPHPGAFAGSAEVWRGRERSAKRSAWLVGWAGMVARPGRARGGRHRPRRDGHLPLRHRGRGAPAPPRRGPARRGGGRRGLLGRTLVARPARTHRGRTGRPGGVRP